jgi:hypothetical protein
LTTGAILYYDLDQSQRAAAGGLNQSGFTLDSVYKKPGLGFPAGLCLAVVANHSSQGGRSMAYSVKKVEVWAGEVADRPGGLAGNLAALSSAGANFEFMIARRAPDKPGTGVVFVTPIKGAKQKRAAQGAGLATSGNLRSVRVEGPDKAGLGAKMTTALADAGINLRGVSAAALGRRSVSYFAFDNAADADNAVRVLKKALK